MKSTIPCVLFVALTKQLIFFRLEKLFDTLGESHDAFEHHWSLIDQNMTLLDIRAFTVCGISYWVMALVY